MSERGSYGPGGDGRAQQAYEQRARVHDYMTVMARLHKKGLLIGRRAGTCDFYLPRRPGRECGVASLLSGSSISSLDTVTSR